MDFAQYSENMNSTTDKENPANVENSERYLSRYVSLCSTLLKEALDESRQEMDGITIAALTPGDEASTELFTRLQSVDRLMQRLTNVQSNLLNLADYFLIESDSEKESEWPLLLDKARNKFTMEQERKLFDELLGGCLVEISQVSDNLTLFSDEESGS